MSLSSVAKSLGDRLTFQGNDMLPAEQQVDKYVQDRITRADERMRPLIPQIQMRYEFWRGNHYADVDSKNKLTFLPTKEGRGKRPWTARGAHNLLMDIVAHEVSAATQRVPTYEVAPTSAAPEKVSAAKTAETLLVYGHDKWSIAQAAVKAVTHAVVGQEAFAFPFFDTSVGPMIVNRAGDGVVGRGEIKVPVYGATEVMWEPGVRFEDSPYHIIKIGQTQQQVVSTPGYFGGVPTPDFVQNRRPDSAKPYNTLLVEVYHYLELPCRSFPKGRWLTIANKRVIAPQRDYPVPEGIALIPLSYITDPDNDRDMGLLQHLIDPMRTLNDAWNKIVEWKNVAINPQLFVAPGVLRGQKITAEPGAVYEIPDPQNNIRWRDVPQLPQELFQIAQEMTGVIARLASQNDIPSNIEAGRAIQALIEKDQARRQSFVSALADWYSLVGSRGLYLGQTYYTEPRLVQIKGRWSPDTIKDFKGAQLLGQIDARVAPASIEPRTKTSMEQKVFAFADRGWITPEQAMAAIEGGYGADLITSYELDVGRITRIIARLKTGEQAMFGTADAPAPSRTEVQNTQDPNTGQTITKTVSVPDYMPRRFDNIPVQQSVLEDWMKTEEFETLSPGLQNTAMEIYTAMLQIEADKQAQAQAAVDAQAQAAGTQNAARSGGASGMPDATSGTGDAAGGNLPTPNQPPDQNTPTG